MKPFPPSSSLPDAQCTALLSSPKSLSFAVSQPQSGVTDLLLHAGVPQLLTRSFIEWLSAHARCFNPLRLGGCAAAPANVHVVYSTTAGSGLQHTTVGNHTHTHTHTHTHHSRRTHTHTHLQDLTAGCSCAAQSFPKAQLIIHLHADNQDDHFGFNPPVHSPTAVV